jgi:hypothetical protein
VEVEMVWSSAVKAENAGHGRALAPILLMAAWLGGCSPGYIKPSDLESREQGPKHCAARCYELGMDMGALVLVSDQLPGCVCVPRASAGKTAPLGAGASTTGVIVLAAAVAARAEQRRQEEQREHGFPGW